MMMGRSKPESFRITELLWRMCGDGSASSVILGNIDLPWTFQMADNDVHNHRGNNHNDCNWKKDNAEFVL